MDEVAFYKAKEELTELCRTYIDKKFETEKSLITQYLGFAGKVAIAGIGIAVLTVGFFGLKTYDDVNKSIQSEIKSRFNSDNPVAKYDGLVKDAAIDGVIASLTARIKQNERFFGAEDSLGFLTRALQDEAVTPERKSQILEFAVGIPSTTYQEPLARSARKLIQVDFKDNRESGVRLMSNLLKLYSSADANSFVTDALNILEKYRDEATIVEGVAGMLDNLDAGNGNRIISKLAAAQGTVPQFHIKMFDLRTNPDAKADPVWSNSLIKKIVERGSVFSLRESEDTVGPLDFISVVNKLKAEDENFWMLCEAFAKEARQKKMVLVFRDRDQFDRGSRPYVGMTVNSITHLIDLRTFSAFYSKIARTFFVRSSQLAEPSPDDLLVLEFWSARLTDDSKLARSPKSVASAVSYAPYFLYSSAGDIRNEADALVAQDRLNNLIAIRLEQENSQPRFRIYWRDALGKMNSVASAKLAGIERSGIRIRTGMGDNDVAMDDEL